MIHTLQEKLVSVTAPISQATNTSATTITIDRAGWDFAMITLYLGVGDTGVSVFKVQESDDSGMAGAADIVGTRYGTDPDYFGVTSVLPSATDDGKFFVIPVNLLGKKRYIDVVCTLPAVGAASVLAIWCELSRGEKGPETAAGFGVGNMLAVA